MVLENKIDQFIGKVALGKTFFEDAAKLLVTMIDEEPDVCERIVATKRADWLTKDVLDTFEAIGRKQLVVDAIFLPKHVLARLIALPTSEQSLIATKPIRVHNGAANRRGTETVVKRASELSRREAAQVIGPNGLRSVEEQKAMPLVVEPDPDRTIGFVELTMMNGKVFVKKVERVARAQKVKLDARGTVVLEVVV